MANTPQQKHLEKPFQQQTDETNVFVKVGDQTLYLHSGILSIYSPVLRDMFLNQQKGNDADGNMTIRLDDKKLEHVVTFFMFFYPEYEKKILHGQTMITDFYTIQAILFMSEEYQVDWIRKEIDDLLCSKKYSKIIPTYMEDTQVTADDLQIFQHVIGKESCSEKSQSEEESEEESEQDSEADSEHCYLQYEVTHEECFGDYFYELELEKKQKRKEERRKGIIEEDRRMRGRTDEEERTIEAQILLFCEQFQLVNVIENLMKEKDFRIYGIQNMMKYTKLKSDTKLNIVMTRIQSQTFTSNVDKETVNHIIEEISGRAYKVQQNENDSQIHLFETKNDSDVIVKVEEHILHLHSVILSHCSPVFKAMLSENFKKTTKKEIKLKDKKAEHVIPLFGFCYSSNLQKLTESTNYEELLSLSQEYQMDWLIRVIEKYLVKTRRFSRDIYRDLETFDLEITGLKLADQFNLKELRKGIAKHVTNLYVLSETDGFSGLSKSTKYELARKSISVSYPDYCCGGQDSNAILKFLDDYFKDI